MNAFADADCLIVVDEQMTNMQQGDLVNVHILAF
jgi:molybdopterin biosynthesis enzyme